MGDAVPFVALGRQHQPLREELRAAFDRVLASDGYILGEEVELFEEEFAAYCGTAHCVGVNSGTAAIALSLIAAGIGPGDEVIVPAHTFIASALGVTHAGATPVFCDVAPGTGLIDAASAETVVGDRTAAVVAVHLYGQACDMDALRALTERHGLALFEDCAQAHGARWRAERVGGFGRAACFSFYPSKNLGALGDAGAVCTDDAELAERVRWLRHIGQRAKGEHVTVGYNERLDGLQAALLRVKLPHLDAWIEARRAAAAAYRDRLPPDLRLLEERPESPCTYHLFPVRTTGRDALAEALGEAGVGTGVHYHPAAHHHPPYRHHRRAGGDCPEATAWAAEELSLPMFETLTEDEVERVVTACGRTLARTSG
jgi:dTDP-3-amino-3,4,6-trideoxy-alpha-D-glucose transaminase